MSSWSLDGASDCDNDADDYYTVAAATAAESRRLLWVRVYVTLLRHTRQGHCRPHAHDFAGTRASSAPQVRVKGLRQGLGAYYHHCCRRLHDALHDLHVTCYPSHVTRHTAHVTPLRNYVWATLAVFSRSFTFGASSEDDAGSKSRPEPGLAPFVDMVNHQENPHVMVQVTSRLTLRAFALSSAALVS